MGYNYGMNTSLSILARALASENLSMSFNPRAKTASFDIKRRHLEMPVWNVSDAVKAMLVCHEISHALWTPQEESDRLFAEAEKDGYNAAFLHRICNCIEDVRIEKLMKAKYPGTRRDFFLGYKEIAVTDMFKFSEMDFNKIGLLNRLNLYFKWAVPGFIDLTLHPEEQTIATEIEGINTFAEVFDLAKRLYDCPEVQQEKEKFLQNQPTQGQGGDEESSDEGDETAEGKGTVTHRAHGMDIIDLPTAFGRKSGGNYESTSLTILPVVNYMDQIITTDHLLTAYDEQESKKENPSLPVNMDTYRKFVRESDAFVRQLVAQFERKKAADEIRRERPKQTGMLNLDRLHQFRTHDDIFLSKIIKQDGKNHGIMFMIDLSGSMSQSLGDCFLQVLQLVWFCEKAKIPFEVFGFTDGMWMMCDEQYKKEHKEWVEARDKGLTNEPFKFSKYSKYATEDVNAIEMGDAKLFHIASSTDAASKRERLLAYLYETYVLHARSRVICLSNTPTVESLILATQVMQKWVVENNIQIPTLMLVTDGEPNGIYCPGSSVPSTFYRKDMDLTITNKITNTIHTVNGQDYSGMNLANIIVATMLDGMRKTLNVRSVGMFIGPNTISEHFFRTFCVSRKEWDDMYRDHKNGDMWAIRNSIDQSPRFKAARETYKEDGAIIVNDGVFPGYDGFFLIKTPKIVKDEDAFANTGNFTKVKNTFIKTMGKRGSSRVFLTRYVDIVSGQPIKTTQDALYRMPFYMAPPQK